MEILSTGEKIRRARIQKGMTLKALCGEEISVSKMSTIENDKVQAEDWILDLVAQRLEIPREELQKDILEEISDELTRLSENTFSQTYEKEILDLIELTEGSGFLKETFLARLQLIDHYIEKSKIEELNSEISNLYKVLIKIVSSETLYLYFLSMAKYLYATNEYRNALVFLNHLMLRLDELPEGFGEDRKLYVPYLTATCYVYLQEYEEARRLLPQIDRLLSATDSNKIRGNIHLLHYLISSSEDEEEAYHKVSDYLAEYPEVHAKAKYLIAVKHLSRHDYEGAYREMNEASKIFPQDKFSDNVELILDAMAMFVNAGHYEEASKYIDLVVNSAIENKNPDTVERAYYFKGILLAESGSYDMAETYMSVSLDMLLKRGRSCELAKRYRDMGNIYYKMGKKDEAIKYYALSVNTKSNCS